MNNNTLEQSMKNFAKVFYIFCCLLVWNLNFTKADDLKILDLNKSNYPEVKMEYFNFGKDIFPIFNNDITNYRLYDNGALLQLSSIQCTDQTINDNASISLMFDLSIKTDNPLQHFMTAQKIADSIINMLPENRFELAISSFDCSNYLNTDFTADKGALQSIINSLKHSDGSFLNSAFLEKPASAFNVLNKAQYSSKSVILITDGSKTCNADSIINIALANSVRIYSVSITDVISDSLQKVTTGTGGRSFLNINNTNELKSIISFIYGFKPCTAAWESPLSCENDHNLEFKLLASGSIVASDTASFIAEDKMKPLLENSPAFLRFSSVIPGKSKSADVVITARNSDITINKLSIPLPQFTISSGNITSPITLSNGQSHKITVTFTPTDSAIVFTKLNIETNACLGNYIPIIGGFPNTPPKTKTLELTSPKCGETLIVGDSTQVTWDGLLPADVVQLEYSIDNGKKWDTLAIDVTDLEYTWKVPDLLSDSCLVRVIQLWPNNIGQTKDFSHPGLVNSANFSRLDGSLLITACKDNNARIWNSNTGQLLFTLSGHTGSVNYADFDQSERYVVTASDDGTAKLWDRSNGKLIRTFEGHTASVKAANFNYDGSKIVTAGTDGQCFIWDTQTGDKLETVVSGGSSLWYATFNPAGNQVLYSGASGKVCLWDIPTKQIVRNYGSAGPYVIQCIAVSPDGKKVATSGWEGYAKVWDYNNGNLLYSISHDTTTNKNAINCVSFNAKGDILLTAGSDYTARMWNADNGEQKAVLREHTKEVMSAFFNFDGSRIVTASWDSLAKVWNLKKRDLQMDTNDCVFSIARAQIISKDIDFGQVPVFDSRDTLVSPFITNATKLQYNISSIKITGDNADEFSIQSGFAPFSLDSAEKVPIELSFTPKGAGLRKAVIEIQLPGSIVKQSISGIGYASGLQLATKLIDFGNVDIDDFKDTTVQVALKNNSMSNITISSVDNAGPDKEHFDLLSPAINNLNLTPGQSTNLTIRFTPAAIGRKNGILYFNYTPSIDRLALSLFGTGVSSKPDTITVYVGDVEGKPGDIIEIPVSVKNITNNGNNANVNGLIANLTFNATLLTPVDEYVSHTDDLFDRTIDLNLSGDIFKEGTLAKLNFKVGLGNDTVSTLRLSNSSPIGGGRIVIKEESGKFTLKNYCTQGGTRLFDPSGKFNLDIKGDQPIQNPVEVVYELLEPGRTLLQIVDLNGNPVSTLFDYDAKPGKYSVSLNPDELSDGVYILILKSPNQKLTKRIMIVKK